MLKSVTIDGYRCFKRLEVNNLKRVNLIVGRNNSGKTSLMEALRIASDQNGSPLTDLLWSAVHRGDYTDRGKIRRYHFGELFFREHGTKLLVASVEQVFGGSHGKTVIHASSPQRYLEIASQQSQDIGGQNLGDGLSIFAAGYGNAPLGAMHASRDLDVEERDLSDPTASLMLHSDAEDSDWIGTSLICAGELARIWKSVVMRGRKQDLIDLLAMIDDRIEDVEFLHAGTDPVRLRSFQVKARGAGFLPLTAYGEGLVRAFAIAARPYHTSSTKCLFFDEIDTGLHHSVMADVWRAVIHAARLNNVQVFATTHSQDCINGLAQALMKEDQEFKDSVAMHALDIGRETTTALDADDIMNVYSGGLEVRGL